MSLARLRANFEASAPVFAALGDATRLRLVSRLCRGGAMSITDLASGASITRQAITKHLHVLASAGLVYGSKLGREQRWELKPQQLREVRRQLDLISQQWEQALDRLKASVESNPDE